MSISTSKSSIFLLFIIKIIFIKNCNGSCYFQSELQGLYVTQTAVKMNAVQYSEIKILEDSIPMWGTCHEKIDNNIVLKMGSNNTECYRCLNLKLMSRNIVRVITKDENFLSRCYFKESEAISSCPDSNYYKSKRYYTETILYKKLDFDGLFIKLEYCPINGRYNFKYKKIEHNETIVHCTNTESTLDNCPSGSALNLRFQKCSFTDYERTYECIGHWEGYNKRKYMAFIDARAEKEGIGPKYRCASYDEYSNGIMNITFSKDSTCSAMNFFKDGANSNIKYSEIMLLYPKEKPTWPHLNFCTFPFWMQGDWQHINVDNDTIMYRDQSSYKAYVMKCVEELYNFNSSGNVIVYSRSQCGEESYKCLKVKNRSTNIMEFKVGHHSSKELTSNICDDYHFSGELWITQGRLKLQYQYSPCPVSGEFVGVIPDLPTLCTKLSSDCTSEDIMFYQVSGCGFDEVYEERKYRCLGQWKEDDYVYAYVQRLDIDTYECFVGTTVETKRIYIKEAGQSCQRHLNPLQYGMEINKIGYCEDSKKSIKYYDPYQGHLINDALRYSNQLGSLQREQGNVILSSIPSVIPSLDAIGHEQKNSHHYDLEGELGDKISIPSDVVISKLSEKNKQLLQDHILLGISSEEMTNSSEIQVTKTTITDTTPPIPEREDENEVDKPYDRSNKRKNKKISNSNHNNEQSESSRIVLNSILLSLAVFLSI